MEVSIMLSKLLKYDLKSKFKVFIPLWIALIVVSIVNRFTLHQTQYDTPQVLSMILYVSLFAAVMVVAVVLIITAIIMNKTKLGRHIYAVGGNSQAARFSGISTAKVKFLVHTYSGIMAGLAGVVLASRMYSGQPTAGDGAEMDAIAAVVVGGTSMAGGSGKIGGTIIGGLIIGVLNNGLNLLNVNSFWQYVVKGTVILLAVFVDYLRNKKAE